MQDLGFHSDGPCDGADCEALVGREDDGHVTLADSEATVLGCGGSHLRRIPDHSESRLDASAPPIGSTSSGPRSQRLARNGRHRRLGDTRGKRDFIEAGAGANRRHNGSVAPLNGLPLNALGICGAQSEGGEVIERGRR